MPVCTLVQAVYSVHGVCAEYIYGVDYKDDRERGGSCQRKREERKCRPLVISVN